MLTEKEAKARRELIRKFHKALLDQKDRLTKKYEELDAAAHGWTQIWDEEDERRQARVEAEAKAAYAELQSVEWMWALVVQVFGKDMVDHALDEGQQRIGDLPYADV